MRKLKIDTLDNDWCDKDELILHACFQILVDFIEKEKPGETIDWGSMPEDSAAWGEMQSLYQWWKDDRRNREDPADKVPFDYMEIVDGEVVWRDDKYPDAKELFAEQSELDEQRYREDTNNLIRLIKIRQWMWS